MQKLLDMLVDLALTAGVRLIAALVLVIVGFKLINWLIKRLKKGKGLSHVDAGAASFILSFVGIALKVVIAITAAAILGVPMTNMVAVLGSAGLAIGLALQGSLSNVAGGLMILLFTPFHVGDFVEADGVSGTVQSINLFYTKLLTPDNRSITIPNGTISNNTITNYSSEATRRVDMTFSVAYSSDIDTVRRLLMEQAQQHELVLQDPAPAVTMAEHGDSAVVFALRVWCQNADYWTVKNDITESAKRAFDQNGVEIPFPQLDVHVVQ